MTVPLLLKHQISECLSCFEHFLGTKFGAQSAGEMENPPGHQRPPEPVLQLQVFAAGELLPECPQGQLHQLRHLHVLRQPLALCPRGQQARELPPTPDSLPMKDDVV
ncbi:hypothetical protein CEXT_204051 [Caerostris extrusa]|uniref:Uncharacterized protein n=1 Tax=Caerostris extrusa TaxID=172846 RepID=A0AAV4RQ96_CAEEX|nr:hypothetical protein CEXT_204051 [Caerostris extrusa]